MGQRVAIVASVGALALAMPAIATAITPSPSNGEVTLSLLSSIKGTGHFNFVYVSGNYAYIATGTNFIIYDVSNPAAPTQVSSTAVTGGFSGVWVQGNFAYMSSYNTDHFSIYDVANPAHPVLMGQATTLKQPYDIFSVGTTSYITDFGGNALQIFDGSNPTAPALLGSISANRPDYVWVKGRYAYVANANNGKTAGGGVAIYDISSPAHPVRVSLLNLGTRIYTLYVSGHYVYATGEAVDELYVIDVSNPAAPVLAGSVNTSYHSGPWDVWVQGKFAYVLDSRRDWLVVYDVSNPSNITQAALGKTQAGVNPQYLYVSGSYVYVAAWQSALLQIWKVGPGSSTSPSQRSSLTAPALTFR